LIDSLEALQDNSANNNNRLSELENVVYKFMSNQQSSREPVTSNSNNRNNNNDHHLGNNDRKENSNEWPQIQKELKVIKLFNLHKE